MGMPMPMQREKQISDIEAEIEGTFNGRREVRKGGGSGSGAEMEADAVADLLEAVDNARGQGTGSCLSLRKISFVDLIQMPV